MKALITELKDRKLWALLIGILAAAVLISAAMILVAKQSLALQYENNLNYGYSAMEAADYESAVEAFEAAYAVDPTHEAAVGLAKAWHASGNTNKAIQVVTSRMELYETNEELEVLLEEYKEAIGYYKTVEIAGETISRSDTAVFFENVTLTEEDKANFSKFKNLVTVSLVNCGLTDMEFLRGCDKLMSVDVSDNPITDFSPLYDKPDLRTLVMDNTAIADVTQLHNLTGVTTLRAGYIWITVDERAALAAALPQCTIHTSYEYLIKKLNMGDKEFYTDAVELDLKDSGVTDISALTQCIKLEKLDVSGNKIGWFSGKFNVPTLTSLNLSGNPLSNIDALEPLTKLTYLNANGCMVTNIKVVGFMPELTELYLSGNPIYHGHSELAKLTKLQKLDLSKALLQDRYLEYLPMESLIELDLRENPNLTEDAVKALVAEHPNCTILHDYQ